MQQSDGANGLKRISRRLGLRLLGERRFFIAARKLALGDPVVA